MIQDIAPRVFHNPYDPDRRPKSEDRIFCFDGEKALVIEEGEAVRLPLFEEMEKTFGALAYTYLFAIDDEAFFLCLSDLASHEKIVWENPENRAYGGNDPVVALKDVPENAGQIRWSFHPIRELRTSLAARKDLVFATFTARQLGRWYRDNRFCGTCGSRTELDVRERAVKCPSCGRMIYPRIIPAVIIAVTNGDEIILTRYNRKGAASYNALIAGFTEIGETLEENVAREVMEEVGLKVKNIRYYKSQPWGIVDDLLVGFFCDVDGDPAIRVDHNELKSAIWTKREDIELQPDSYSLTNEMMTIFKEGREPRFEEKAVPTVSEEKKNERETGNEIAIAGLGALGTLYAYHLTKALGKERVFVLADSGRIARYEEEGIYFNGEKCDFRYKDIDQYADSSYPAMLMVCCKYGALPAMIEGIKPWVGGGTVILSILNGIESEHDLRAVFPEDQVVSCVARKMSAVKEGNWVTAIVPGELVIGPEREKDGQAVGEKGPFIPGQRMNAYKAAALLAEASFPFVLSDDIERELWSKLLCNVGVNQSTMVHETTYGGIQVPGEARDDMIAAMKEVEYVAQAEGIDLTDEDVDTWVGIMDGLDPTGEPSMRQDGKAHRPSEVELFSGTIVRLAAKHGLSVPVNEKWYRLIKERESSY